MPFLAFLALLRTSRQKNIHIFDCFSDCLGAAQRWLHVGTKHCIIIILSSERQAGDKISLKLAFKAGRSLVNKAGVPSLYCSALKVILTFLGTSRYCCDKRVSNA
jgi:hypothetical protein